MQILVSGKLVYLSPIYADFKENLVSGHQRTSDASFRLKSVLVLGFNQS